MITKKPKRPENFYIDNKEFAKALMDYKRAVRIAKKEKREKPPIPNYIGECFLKIAEHLSYHHKFIDYSYRDEMVADGVENCLMYFENFNPNAISKNTGKKTAGPFPYFTQIIYYAFVRRISKEKKQQYVKAKSMENSNIMNELTQEDIELLGKDVDTKQGSNTADLYTNISEFIANFEAAIQAKKDKKMLAQAAKKKDDNAPVVKKRRKRK